MLTLLSKGIWVVGRPQLEPVEFSMVVQTGTDGYACVVEGSNGIFLPSTGYIDGKNFASDSNVSFSKAVLPSTKPSLLSKQLQRQQMSDVVYSDCSKKDVAPL